MRFRKKPVVVDAVFCHTALLAFLTNWDALPEWLRVAYEKGGVVPTPEGVYLPTPEGSMLAKRTDWIVRGTQGELYPVKPEIFAEVYEPV